MEISNVTVRAGSDECLGYSTAPNTDGFNIGGQRIWVHDSSVRNGDDCVPTNIGFNGTDSTDILVERVDCSCGTNGGVPIMANGATIRNVVYRDMVVRRTNQGAGAKISEAYENVTGTFENITWRNITILEPRNAAIYTNVFQEDAAPPQCTVPSNASARVHWLSAFNLTFSSIRATINSTGGSVHAGCFVCGPTRPCTGFLFEDVVVTDVAEAPVHPLYVCANMEFSAAGSSPPPCGPLPGLE
jgi:hypothetical protein